MKTKEQLIERLKQYKGIEYLYFDYGYIAWQVSTGENVEIVFIETKEFRKGYGKKLIQEMCKRIKPFNSVFVFRMASNENAGKFYRGLGFKEHIVHGLYKVDAVMGIISFKDLGD